MPEFFADPNALHPVVLPDGTPHTGTVFLKPALSHPRIEVGDYSYASAHHPPEDWAACLAPYLYPFSPERLIIPKFINKIDKCLISFRPNGRKCYNKSAVRLALAG